MRSLTAALLLTAFSATAANAIPNFAPAASSGWFAYSRDFMRPASGPGPIQQDRNHPRVTNDDFRATGKQPTNAIADLSNPVLLPWAREVVRKFNDQALAGIPVVSQHAQCRAVGVTNFDLEPMTRPMFILQGKNEVTLILESFGEVRHVFLTDHHSQNLKPSWYGESIGHYEGDTLVVDTIGFNDKTEIDGFHTPHTTQLHTVERFHLVDGGRELQIDVHVEDLGAFTTPWNAVQRYRQFELVARNAKQSGVQLTALATPDDGPLSEAVCADSPISLQFIPGASIPVAKTPDF
ncbi:MAG TPA: hypothetical protein VFW28_04340 [Micropepsaceae bacterium]|nr:hypothetical protein [Micropepsaceae bacterium]